MKPRDWWVGAAFAAALLVGPAGVLAQGRQGLLSLPEGRLFYEVVGQGDPVVVIHGGPGLDHQYLRPGMDVLASSLSLIYYDQRGTGRSEVDMDSASVNLDAFIQDIDQLRQALGYERITVLGHSFGGLIALGYAFAHPESVRALVLMDTAEPGSRWASETQRSLAASRTPADSAELADLVASPGYEKRDPETMSRIYQVAFRGTMRDPQRVTDLRLSLGRRTAQNGPDVARLLGGSMGDFDWWDRLPGLDVPTLVVHGRFDPLPLAMTEALAKALPQGRLEVLETGHFPYVEDPAGLTAAVAGFLAGVGR
ncbi:MAG TPA: alpha/beta fold hydrolase [Longimicrobiales bacterium]|nr:alpha/beta fold hydrolase [Longimicrobiales bacterium]